VAFSVVDTHIQNPARRAGKGRKNMAQARRKMSAKQIKHFGTKRQKAALKAKRSRPTHRARTRSNPPKGGGRVISGYGSTVMNPRRRRRNPGNHKIVINPARRKKRAVAKKSTVKRRRNPLAQILSWTAGNPAKRRHTVATHRRKTKRRATAHRSNAGRRRAAPKRVIHHRRRSNPAGLGRPMDWLQGGAGVIAGVVVTRAIPQMLMGASNTGPMGYVANAAAALGAGWLTHMLFPRNQVLVAAVIAGGFGGLLSRIIADKTPFGAQLSLTGLGDHGFGLYQKSNYPAPPHLIGGRPGQPASSAFTWGGGEQVPVMSGPYGNDSTSAC
jgi:hypothetical protein